MDNEDLELDNNVEYLEDVADDSGVDDILNDIMTESQPIEPEEDEFDKNTEGVTGDEWEEEAEKDLLEKIKRERNKANAERRLAEKKAKQQEGEEEETEESEEEEEEAPEEVAVKEADYFREKFEAQEEKLKVFEPIAQMLYENKVDQNSLRIGVDFINSWRKDPVNCAKTLLQTLEKSGIDLDTVLLHEPKGYDVEREVNRQVSPLLMQQQQQAQAEKSRRVVDDFIGRYPDAEDHLGEIVEVMQKMNSRDPYDAYFRLRRVYKDQNIDWIPRREVYNEPVQTRVPMSSKAQTFIEEPVPTSIDDLIRQETDKYFRR